MDIKVSQSLGNLGLSKVAHSPNKNIDTNIMSFALNLEYLEVELYKNWDKVTYDDKSCKDFGRELYENEAAHVKFYQQSLGSKKFDKPKIDVVAGVSGAAVAAGLIKEGEEFDPYDSEINFFLSGMLIEDVGVTLYTGAVPLLTDKEVVAKVAGILAVEAHHMGMVRSYLYQKGKEVIDSANAISKARNTIDGNKGLDQGIEVNGRANFVPADKNAMTFARTPRQGLDLVFLENGADKGGFFPDGFNGDIEVLL